MKQYHNSKLKISTASTKAKSWEPAYSQAHKKNKIDRQGSTKIQQINKDYKLKQCNRSIEYYFRIW